jgi:hypothetical protein
MPGVKQTFSMLVHIAGQLFDTMRRQRVSDDEIHRVLMDLFGPAVLQQAGLLDR